MQGRGEKSIIGDHAVELWSRQGPQRSPSSASPFYRSSAVKAERREGTGPRSHGIAPVELGLERDRLCSE